MKKIIAVVLCAVLMLSCFSMVASAKVGDVIGLALHTDIVAYINHYAIPSFAVNGQSMIVAEDLRNFGFDVIWNQWDRTLKIYRNHQTKVNKMQFAKTGRSGSKFANVLETNIKVYANGKLIPSYNIDGYTLIPMEELYVFGPVFWVPEERAIKLWVDGVHMLATKQYVEIRPGNISSEEAIAMVKAYMSDDLGQWVAGEDNVLLCDGIYNVNGKEYYSLQLRGLVSDGNRKWSTTLTWFVVAADGSEVFEGRCDAGRLIRY